MKTWAWGKRQGQDTSKCRKGRLGSVSRAVEMTEGSLSTRFNSSQCLLAVGSGRWDEVKQEAELSQSRWWPGLEQRQGGWLSSERRSENRINKPGRGESRGGMSQR